MARPIAKSTPWNIFLMIMGITHIAFSDSAHTLVNLVLTISGFLLLLLSMLVLFDRSLINELEHQLIESDGIILMKWLFLASGILFLKFGLG